MKFFNKKCWIVRILGVKLLLTTWGSRKIFSIEVVYTINNVGKYLKLHFWVNWKVIDSVLIKDILTCEFPIIIGNILLWDLF